MANLCLVVSGAQLERLEGRMGFEIIRRHLHSHLEVDGVAWLGPQLSCGLAFTALGCGLSIWIFHVGTVWASTQDGSWILRASILRGSGGSCITFYDLTSDVT